MTFIVKPLDPLDLREVAEQAAESHARPYLSRFDADAVIGPKFGGWLNGELVAAAGVVPVYGDDSMRAVAWAILFPKASQAFLQIHRAVKLFLDSAPYNRIECHTDAAFSVANHWAALLGFTLEAEGLRCFFPNGAAANQWARVKEY